MRADPETVALIGAIWVHDLVNLLLVAETSALLLERTDGDAEKVQKHARRIRETLASAKLLVSRCLAIGRGEPVLRKAEGLAEMAREAWDQSQAEGMSAAIVVEVAAEVELLVERSFFVAVLMNLMRNAVDAMASTVRISIVGETVRITDDGSGFEKTEVARGNGIGLDGCRALMRLHGATLAIEKLERGTAVTLSGEDLIRRATG